MFTEKTVSLLAAGLKFLTHPTGFPITTVLFMEFYGEI